MIGKRSSFTARPERTTSGLVITLAFHKPDEYLCNTIGFGTASVRTEHKGGGGSLGVRFSTLKLNLPKRIR